MWQMGLSILYDHVAAWGIEGLVNEEFKSEIKRRLTIFL